MFDILESKWNPVQTPGLPHDKTWLHGDLRGAHPALEVSEGFLRGQEVVVLVLEVIQLQVTCSIHSEQLVSCGNIKEVSEVEKEGGVETNKKKETGKEQVCTWRIKERKWRDQGKTGQHDAELKFFHSVEFCQWNSSMYFDFLSFQFFNCDCADASSTNHQPSHPFTFTINHRYKKNGHKANIWNIWS